MLSRRMLPVSFPRWKTVNHIFRKWCCEETLSGLNDRLRSFARRALGKTTQPTAAILDSQSVKSAPHGGEVGYDAGKKIKGRKRHLLVDTQGFLLGVQIRAECPYWNGFAVASTGCEKCGWTAATAAPNSPRR